MNPAPRQPPTGHRDEDGRLHDLDFNDPATFDWIQAKQAEHQTASDNRARNQRRAKRKTQRRQRRASRS